MGSEMLTPKQTQVLTELKALDTNPTVRSLADRMESRYHRAERWSDHEIRGLLERLIAAGEVAKYRDNRGAVRYEALGVEDASTFEGGG